ncbi:hypothetical protein INS49_009326 [Diaporthe citri]|uniref:uncharacterized protein n=1 Tax=Diaporthe citri TaxID=83186 RepID=UPI001C8272DC|nr:uncharacterized protein INS49_009326 [Diaporthe citri]KAG6361102.1 hypothetical protein INS49_009326 [Diaporthe citri]
MDPTAILRHDTVRPAMPSVLLALEHADSDDYFQQLLSIDSALQALDTPRDTLTLELQAVHKRRGRFATEYMVAERPLVELKGLIQMLETLQTAARKGFNSRARSLRKVKVGIMDLPNELLHIIFGHLKRRLDDPNFSFDLVDVDPDADAMAIQNVRLTCRRFRDNSSHLLVRQFDISPTQSSLEHLEEVARHPEIWRGERVLKIDLRYYSAAMAGDLQAFSAMCYEKLRNKIDSYEAKIKYSDDESSDKDKPPREVEEAVAQLRRILLSWEPFADGNPTRKRTRRHGAAALALRRGHERYRELFQQQQEILRGGHFARVVAEAAASSRSEVWLSMTDTGRHPDDDGPHMQHVGYSDLEELADPDFLVQSCLIQPHAWWHAKGRDAGEVPQSLLHELPLAMSAAKACLAGVAANITRPFRLGLNMSQDQLSGLSEVAEGLEAFTFRMFEGIHPAHGPRPSPEEMSALYAYIRASIGPQCVPNLWLDLSTMEFIVDELGVAYVATGRLSIEPLLCSPSWHRLRYARLEDLEMDLQDLTRFMGMLESKVRFDLREIYLSSGTWAAALDYLRSKAASGSQLLPPEGPDCRIRLTDAEYFDIFVKQDPIEGVTKATQYITSVEGVENPCPRIDEAIESSPEP